jgi:hypothetical protein
VFRDLQVGQYGIFHPGNEVIRRFISQVSFIPNFAITPNSFGWVAVFWIEA